jgi:hypothetical protein
MYSSRQVDWRDWHLSSAGMVLGGEDERVEGGTLRYTMKEIPYISSETICFTPADLLYISRFRETETEG